MVSQNRVICYLLSTAILRNEKEKICSICSILLYFGITSQFSPFPMTNQACCSIPPVGQPTAVPENQTDQAAGVNLCAYNNWPVCIRVLIDSPCRCVRKSISQARCSAYLRHIRALPSDQGRGSTTCPGIERQFNSWSLFQISFMGKVQI